MSQTISIPGASKADFESLSDQIANPSNVAYTNITGTSQSTFETALTSAINGMGTGMVRLCSAYANYSQSLTNGGVAIAFLYKQTANFWWCFLVFSGNVKAGYYQNSTWTWL